MTNLKPFDPTTAKNGDMLVIDGIKGYRFVGFMQDGQIVLECSEGLRATPAKDIFCEPKKTKVFVVALWNEQGTLVGLFVSDNKEEGLKRTFAYSHERRTITEVEISEEEQ